MSEGSGSEVAKDIFELQLTLGFEASGRLMEEALKGI